MPLNSQKGHVPIETLPNSAGASPASGGRLVVDLADPHRKTLKWRGIAKGIQDPSEKPKSADIVEKTVAKMFRQYPVGPAKR
jgi:hypothetical protein